MEDVKHFSIASQIFTLLPSSLIRFRTSVVSIYASPGNALDQDGHDKTLPEPGHKSHGLLLICEKNLMNFGSSHGLCECWDVMGEMVTPRMKGSSSSSPSSTRSEPWPGEREVGYIDGEIFTPGMK